MNIDLASAEIRYTYIGGGVVVYSCFLPQLDVPVGTAWYIARKTHDGRTAFDVADIYVVHFARRKGVARWMLEKLLSQCDMLRTDTGTKDGGLDLIKSIGFKLNKQAGIWIVSRKRKPE